MIDGLTPSVLAILVIGAVTIAAPIIRASLDRLGLPDVIGYLLIGLALSLADEELGFLTGEVISGLEVLAATGVVVLLFRVGLESNPAKLIDQLPKAGLALIGSIIPSALLGYLTVRYLFGEGMVPALFVGTALTATSVGVSVTVWREFKLIDSDDGALLVDLAELDDIAAVILMALLLSIAPFLRDGTLTDETPVLGQAGWLIFKIAALAALCILFARFLERRVTRWFARIEAEPAPVLPVAGLGFIVAAIAGLLGFSLAVGALLAGLAFSRDPERMKLDQAFETLSRFFVPFFFVGIGLKVDMSLVLAALGVGLPLLLVAVAAKLLGTALPILLASGGAGALLLGVSMIPRAEIAMIIMDRGHGLGEWAVPAELYGGMVFVSLGSCLVAPVLVRYLLRRRLASGER